MDKKSREYKACLCYNTTRGQIEDIIVEKDITDLKELCQVAKVGDKCGGCREDLEMILNETHEKMGR